MRAPFLLLALPVLGFKPHPVFEPQRFLAPPSLTWTDEDIRFFLENPEDYRPRDDEGDGDNRRPVKNGGLKLGSVGAIVVHVGPFFFA